MAAQPITPDARYPQPQPPAYEWPLWSTTLRVVTSDPHALSSARRLVQTELAHVEREEGRSAPALGSTALARAVDRCAQQVADILDVGALVSLGGVVATAGPAGLGAWEIQLQDQADEAAVIAVPTGLALATATTETPAPWRSATVVAPDSVTANTWAVAALGAGVDAAQLLAWQCLPARLVADDGSVCLLGGWPDDTETAESTYEHTV